MDFFCNKLLKQFPGYLQLFLFRRSDLQDIKMVKTLPFWDKVRICGNFYSRLNTVEQEKQLGKVSGDYGFNLLLLEVYSKHVFLGRPTNIQILGLIIIRLMEFEITKSVAIRQIDLPNVFSLTFPLRHVNTMVYTMAYTMVSFWSSGFCEGPLLYVNTRIRRILLVWGIL
jgi:hypothetical protein